MQSPMKVSPHAVHPYLGLSALENPAHLTRDRCSLSPGDIHRGQVACSSRIVRRVCGAERATFHVQTIFDINIYEM